MYPRDGRVVRRGIFFYDNVVECDVVIVESDTRYGSGDYEDPPEISDDQAVTTYYINFGSTTSRGVFNAASIGHSTLEEAIREAEGALQGLRWL